jgi:ABC-type uncharacterized transport system auxiliary subunit
MNSSKKVIFSLVVAAATIFSSCQKESLVNNTNNLTGESIPVSTLCGTATTSALLAGQTINMGNVSVVNNSENLYVTYTAEGNWELAEVHLYVGAAAGIPKTNNGNAIPGQFPYKVTFNAAGVKSYTFAIPLSNLDNCFTVAAHASVRLLNDNGNVIQSETAWGAGSRINQKGNWATAFTACEQACDETANEGCSMSQGFWFASPVSVWPSTGVTVAGFSYTEAEAKAIWNTSNANGLRDSKKGFTQVAAIKLSGTVAPNASVWADVTIVENWLATLGKLSESNLPTGNADAAAAAGRIGDWITANHCN